MGANTFSGNVRIAQVNADGVVQGSFIGVVNTTKLELVVPAPTNIDQISRKNGTVGQIVSRAQVPKATSLNVDIDDTDDQRILAYALNGVTAAYSQTGGSITDEVITAPTQFGDWAVLANRHVSAVVVKDATGVTTYVAGTDYVVDAVPGFIRIVEGGAITSAESLKVSYTAAAITGKSVQGAKVASNLLRIEGQLTSLVDGSEWYFVCPIFQASSSGNQDLFGSKMLVASLAGAMFLPPTGTAADTETGGAPFVLTAIQ